ncbi:MAG: three-Cys-motif partner protein TcmP [Cyanobacteria bacterium P01_H01_bin.15]
MVHEFGGVWTRKKLSVLEAYLKFYVTALKNQPFTLHYADAFAGTGSHAPLQDDEQKLLIPQEDFRGSVMTALEVSPGFNEFHFNDLSPEHVSELHSIRKDNPEKKIHIYEQDANEFVPAYCSRLTRKDRAVLLLDPYSTQLDWETLKHVADSKKVDLWLLFPISVILRMTPRDGTKIRQEWKRTLDRLLGTNTWEESLYKPIEVPAMGDMFEEPDPDPTPLSERLNTKELEQWVTNRLRELFPYVAPPIPLNNKGRPLFLFYFAVSNDSSKAWGLAQRAASHIIGQNLGSD